MVYELIRDILEIKAFPYRFSGIRVRSFLSTKNSQRSFRQLLLLHFSGVDGNWGNPSAAATDSSHYVIDLLPKKVVHSKREKDRKSVNGVDEGMKKSNYTEDELEKIKAARGLPQRIKVDNGPEFISQALDAWAYFNKVKLGYSRPCTSTDNPHIESFNGSFQDECLNINLFMSLEDARDKIELWRRNYNGIRPHSAVSY